MEYEKVRDSIWEFCKKHGISSIERNELLKKIEKIFNISHL